MKATKILLIFLGLLFLVSACRFGSQEYGNAANPSLDPSPTAQNILSTPTSVDNLFIPPSPTPNPTLLLELPTVAIHGYWYESIILLDPISGANREIFTRFANFEGEPIQLVTWSIEKCSLLVSSRATNQLKLIWLNIQTLIANEILDVSLQKYTGNIETVSISPNYSRLAIHMGYGGEVYSNQWDLLIAEIEGTSIIETQVIRNVSHWSLWSPTQSNLLAYFANDENEVQQLYLYSVVDSSSTQLTNFSDPHHHMLGVDWSPTGSEIALVHSTGNLVVVPVDTNLETLTFPLSMIGSEIIPYERVDIWWSDLEAVGMRLTFEDRLLGGVYWLDASSGIQIGSLLWKDVEVIGSAPIEYAGYLGFMTQKSWYFYDRAGDTLQYSEFAPHVDIIHGQMFLPGTTGDISEPCGN